MSPDYKNWNLVPQDVRKLVRAKLEELSLEPAHAIQEGFAFVLSGHGETRKITKVQPDLSALSPQQRNDARKQTSPWHVVSPLLGSSSNKMENHPLFAQGSDELPRVKPGRNERPRHGWHKRRVK